MGVSTIPTILALVVGYLLGSFPTGVVVARLHGGVDLTRVGSGRTGATNVLRTLGKKAAAVVFLGDFVKGTIAVALGGLIVPGDPWALTLAALGAVLGHSYSPFLGFKGGRGVATGFGALLAAAPTAAGIAVLVGVATIALTRYVSLGSILGATTAAVVLVAWTLTTGQSPAYAAFGVLVGGFIVVAHHDNIDRLLHGTERRLGQRVQLEH